MGVGRRNRPALLNGLKLTCGHLAAAAVAFEFEADLLAFREGGHPCPLDRRDVHKHVRATCFGLNETKALGCVKPLYDANLHSLFLFGARDRHAQQGERTQIFGEGSPLCRADSVVSRRMAFEPKRSLISPKWSLATGKASLGRPFLLLAPDLW